MLLLQKSLDWCFLTYQARIRIPSMILFNDIPPTLTFTQEQARSIIGVTLTWFRRLLNDDTWAPQEGMYVSSYLFSLNSCCLLVSGLRLGLATGEAFSTNLADPKFCDLLCDQLRTTLTVFFRRVRTAIRNIIYPPRFLPHEIYPRFHLAPSIPTDSNAEWLGTLIKWDPRWGFRHWHQYVENSTGTRVSNNQTYLNVDFIIYSCRSFGSPILSHGTPWSTHYGYATLQVGSPSWSPNRTLGWI